MNPETIFAAITAATALIEYVNKARTDLNQDEEMTRSQREELDAKIASIPQLSHWQVND